MSYSLQSTSPPQSPSSHPYSHTELAARVERFQKAAQDLLAVCEPQERSGSGNAAPHLATEAQGETRCYYLSANAVQHERELLSRYGADDLRGLLGEAHMLLAGLVKVMKSMSRDVRVRGSVIVSLGCLLDQVSALLLRMKNVYGKAEPVRAD